MAIIFQIRLSKFFFIITEIRLLSCIIWEWLYVTSAVLNISVTLSEFAIYLIIDKHQHMHFFIQHYIGLEC